MSFFLLLCVLLDASSLHEMLDSYASLVLFFVNDTASTEIYTYGHTLSLHDALPISSARCLSVSSICPGEYSEITPSSGIPCASHAAHRSRRNGACRSEGTRLNSSH